MAYARFVSLGALALSLLAACGSHSAADDTGLAQERTYVGSVEGTDAALAVVQRGNDWVAYVCGGKTTYATLTRWYQGQIAATGDELHGVTGGVTLAARLANGVAEGTLTGLGERAYDFHAVAVQRDSAALAGLYAAVDSGCRAGLVVIQQGPQESAPVTQGVWCDDSGRFAQVTPILPIQTGADGLLVRVDEVARDIYMRPATPSLP